MRTTVDIPDELFRRAKSEAALRGRKLKDLVEEGLRLVIEQEKLPATSKKKPAPKPRPGSLHEKMQKFCGIFEVMRRPTFQQTRSISTISGGEIRHTFGYRPNRRISLFTRRLSRLGRRGVQRGPAASYHLRSGADRGMLLNRAKSVASHASPGICARE